jgi:hypothetical protein
MGMVSIARMDVQEHNQPGVSRSLSVALYLIVGYVLW